MAVIYVRPQSDLAFGTDQMGVRTITHSYVVKSNVFNESKLAILGCGLLPVYGYSPHPQDLAAICSRIDIKQKKEGSQFWDVYVEWRTFAGPRDPREQQLDPPDRRPVWRYSFQPLSKYWPADLDGKAFMDRAGTPFEQYPDRPIYVDEVTVTRYEASFDRTFDRTFLNAFNTDSWLDAGYGEALVQNIATEDVYEFGRYWVRRTFTVLVSPRVTIAGTLAGGGGTPFVGAWDAECFLNQGSRYIGTDGKPHPVMNAGFLDGRPQRLDADGKLLAATAANVYLKFRMRNGVAFAPLNLVPPY